ncbi:hypothetical protein PVAP13_4NG013800 [Panicum virgatum]|uniref:Uncharacterized protein n=1 Tax=Panicum virgatum TaxID=38727 RepID=A0A8T0SYH3_PANVG|nr:hypothetical protein PVAP13_4NG013800 [Panicum virgatum]
MSATGILEQAVAHGVIINSRFISLAYVRCSISRQSIGPHKQAWRLRLRRRPARLELHVTRARYSRGKSSQDSVVELLLTLAANNTSKRAAVRYESMFVDLTNSTVVRAESMSFVRANLTMNMPLSQRRESVANFSATLVLVPGLWTDSSGNLMTNRFAVIVTAMARFKVGIAWTRLFDIKLACQPLSFIPVEDAAAKPSGGAPDGLPPVDCVSR